MKYLVLILLIAVSYTSRAQSARELFESARGAYEKGDNATTIQLLRSCEAALGKTNPRIESLRALCYSNLGDWVNASVALNSYFRIAPSSNIGTNAHNDLVALREKVDGEIRLADKNFKKELDDKRMEEANTIEQQHESEEKSRAAAVQKESESRMYEIYKNSTDPEELSTFLTMFPKSARANDIQFKKYEAEGDLDMKAERWTPAVENYTKAIEIRSDEKVRVKLVRARDEQLYKTTVYTNTIEGYENYLAKFPSGIHKVEADKVLQKNYLRLARQYVTASDFDKAVYYYKAYQNRYPYGPEIQTVNTELCSYYVAEAKKAETKKEIGSVQRALTLWGNASDCGMAASNTHIKSLNRKITRWSRDDVIFYGWHADQTNLLGIMTGSLNNRKIGISLSARLGSGFFKTPEDWKTDSTNSLDESSDKDKSFTGDIVPNAFHLNFSLTKKIVHPFWIYAGGGVLFNGELRKFETPEGDEEFVKNKNATYTAFNPEGGLFLVLGPIVFRYGVNKPMSSKYTGPIIQHFGIAIKM